MFSSSNKVSVELSIPSIEKSQLRIGSLSSPKKPQKIMENEHSEKKKDFIRRSEERPSVTKPAFLQPLRNFQIAPEQNLEFDMIINGFPKPSLSLYKNSNELKLNEYRKKWIGNKVSITIYHEYWRQEAVFTVIAENEAGSATNECIIYSDEPFEMIEIVENEAEIDSSDIPELSQELRLEQVDVDIDEDSLTSEDYLPRELSPIFEVTEDELTRSLRSAASSRRSSIRSVESIRSTLTMLTPTQSFVVERNPEIQDLTPLSTISAPISERDDKTPTPEKNPDVIDLAEANYRNLLKNRAAEVSIVNDLQSTDESRHDSRRNSLVSLSTINGDDDAISLDSYATIDPPEEPKYRSTEDLMSFVSKNFVEKTSYITDTTTTDTETDTSTVYTPATGTTVASPTNTDLFPTPTSTMRPALESPVSMTSGFSEKSRQEFQLRRASRENLLSNETESELETNLSISLNTRTKRKMTEEECRKKERQKSFQQKYRLTQRFIEDSIKGNATNLEIARRELRNAQLGHNSVIENEDLTRKNLLSDSEVFLDTDDDGMDTISEITIDFGGRNTRNEFEIGKDSFGKHFVDL
ncbi:Oidioi.mRNA.OKI2018_I69.PAR.g10790.t1.cds [Oikopleura dioica]|uniref:Oidioi.mRNA.OKI2018_I69.PAR.g10790.t1.cds n=1 Tax=Oikopleura dioica TaxID=34765 RepID=A0ABN7RXZ2_OIKDI|nr:Oidioi.mRNA.OKI2018_I69.PAR.g10790.t1.cds [Oikopleura dioica]